MAANARVHEELDERMLVFLETLTALELEEATRAFERFRALLVTHLTFEDETVFPVVARLHAIHGDEKDPLPKHLDGDHRILERTLRKVEAALAALRAAEEPRRRALVRDLDTFLLLRRVLEHHDQRETRFAYPLLEQHASDDERQAIATGLAEALADDAR